MDRREELWAFTQEFFEEKMWERDNIIQKAFEDGGNYRQTFMFSIAELFKQLKQQQLEQGKEELHYIGFYFLRSSSLINKAEIMIAAYNEGYYLDDIETIMFWQIDDLLSYAEADMLELLPSLKKKFIRLKDYEVTELKHQYLINYIHYIMQFFKNLFPVIFRLPEFAEVNSALEINVVCGELMEKSTCLYTHRKSETS